MYPKGIAWYDYVEYKYHEYVPQKKQDQEVIFSVINMKRCIFDYNLNHLENC